jgi:hypothetical protein
MKKRSRPTKKQNKLDNRTRPLPIPRTLDRLTAFAGPEPRRFTIKFYHYHDKTRRVGLIETLRTKKMDYKRFRLVLKRQLARNGHREFCYEVL